MNDDYPTITSTIYDYIEVNGRISKKLFQKVVEPKLAQLDEAIAVLKEIANEDYRGNRSSGSVKAYQVLKKLGYME